MDTARIRRDFPILQRQVHGQPLVYLDNAATTQKPRAVIGALVDFYERHNANVHRGVHTLSEEASALYEDARATVARFLGAPAPECIVFARGTTDAINLVAQAWGRQHLRSGDEIVLTELEHHSNIVPWQIVARERGALLRFIPMTAAGTLDVDAAERLIGPRTRLLALTHTSNVLGTLTPLERLTALARRQGARVLVDAAQAAAHCPLDVGALDCDWLAFSGHKVFGPTGIGVLYTRQALLPALQPPVGGGGAVLRVSEHETTYRDPPWCLEPGTPPIAQAAGLGAALAYLQQLGVDAVRAHEGALVAEALQALRAVPGVTVHGPPEGVPRGAAVSFNVDAVHAHDVAQILDEVGVACRAGHHCCQLALRRLGLAATVRASFAVYNERTDIARLIEGVHRVQEIFGDTGRKRAVP